MRKNDYSSPELFMSSDPATKGRAQGLGKLDAVTFNDKVNVKILFTQKNVPHKSAYGINLVSK